MERSTEGAMGQARAFATYLDELREAVLKVAEPLDEETLNRRPPGLTNTPGILLRHLVGSERYWIHRTVGGDPVKRDRDAEFAPQLPVRKSEVLAELSRVGARTREILEHLPDEALEERVEVQRGERTETVTKLYAILQTIAHYSYHLGQLRVHAKLLGG